MQKLWEANLSWDEPLSDELKNEWYDHLERLKDISLITVPRLLGTMSDNDDIELHGFSDASKDSIGAVVYLRTRGPGNSVNITIIASKSKLAPQQKSRKMSNVTIPRLELSAAVLLVELTKQIQETLNSDKTQVHLWTDSSIAYHWIMDIPSRWKDFVRNRVSLIQETLSFAKWHHIPGSDNPADLVSRGAYAVQLANHQLWWNGPNWLRQSSECWPHFTDDEMADLEIRPDTVRVHITQSFEKIQIEDPSPITKYSDFSTLLRVIAWCRRFWTNLTAKKTGSSLNNRKYLSPTEEIQAQECIEKVIQRVHFAQEIKILASGGSLAVSHPLKRLTPFLDNRGVLRVDGRLSHTVLDNNANHPIILPRSHFSMLVLQNVHRKTLHGGVQLMLSTLRQRYWILGGRAPVRNYLKTCVKCVRQRGVPLQQLMGSLPECRMSPHRPFLVTGVDYAGPFHVKSRTGRRVQTYKDYLVIFVCMTTSAVHLDMATDYSTKGFLGAFRRFTARRGHCTDLYIDCGTNFVGADTELKRMFNGFSKDFGRMIQTLSMERTRWHFNPPAAPHFGGKWEAAVKSTKHHIKRTVGESLMTYEEWSTLLAQIEAILNSRPLCPLSDDPEDLEPLMPGHFLIGNPISLVPENNFLSLPESRLTRLQRHPQYVGHFWERWSIEYLQWFLIRPKWKTKIDNVQIGSLVLLIDERLPPCKWSLARILQLHPGTDGLVRVATLKTATSILTRPVTKLCLLPVEASTPECRMALIRCTRQGGQNVAATDSK